MSNRCRRCNRELSNADALYGWRCAEILGVSGELSKMGAEIFRKFVDGVMKAQKLFGNSNFEFTDEQWKKLYSAFAKMSLWDGVDERKVKEARKEGRGQGRQECIKAFRKIQTNWVWRASRLVNKWRFGESSML